MIPKKINWVIPKLNLVSEAKIEKRAVAACGIGSGDLSCGGGNIANSCIVGSAAISGCATGNSATGCGGGSGGTCSMGTGGS